MEPAQGIWRYLRDRDGEADPVAALKTRTIRTRDTSVVEDVVGSGWSSLQVGVVHSGGFSYGPNFISRGGAPPHRKRRPELTGAGASADRQSSRLLSWAEAVRKRAAIRLKSVAPQVPILQKGTTHRE